MGELVTFADLVRRRAAARGEEMPMTEEALAAAAEAPGQPEEAPGSETDPDTVPPGEGEDDISHALHVQRTWDARAGRWYWLGVVNADAGTLVSGATLLEVAMRLGRAISEDAAPPRRRATHRHPRRP